MMLVIRSSFFFDDAMGYTGFLRAMWDEGTRLVALVNDTLRDA